MIKSLPDGRWRVDVEPVKGKRHRKTVKTKAEAKRYEAHIRAKYAQNTEWSQTAKDRRRLTQIIEQWFSLHGHSLRDGDRRARALQVLAGRLGNPIAADLKGHHYSQYRAIRAGQGIAPKTLNNELGYLKAVYNEMQALGSIHYDCPITGVRSLKVPERELSWLTTEQIQTLLHEIRERTDNPHVEVITLVCLATGARWSEAEGLTLDKIRNGAVIFSNTKSGKVRVIPIIENLEAKLTEHLKIYRHMSSSITAFRRALGRTGIELPKGQAAHALRHTFASHFVMNGGNILTLQKVLGHSTINMTMRYAHLAPDHLKEVLKFGALVMFR